MRKRKRKRKPSNEPFSLSDIKLDFDRKKMLRKIEAGYRDFLAWWTYSRVKEMIKERRRILDITEKFNEKQLKRLNAKTKAKQRHAA